MNVCEVNLCVVVDLVFFWGGGFLYGKSTLFFFQNARRQNVPLAHLRKKVFFALLRVNILQKLNNIILWLIYHVDIFFWKVDKHNYHNGDIKNKINFTQFIKNSKIHVAFLN